MKRFLKINGLAVIDENETAQAVELKAAEIAVATFDLIEEFGTEVRIGGPEFQALLHTPCKEYQA